jgi:hypothetical protein
MHRKITRKFPNEPNLFQKQATVSVLDMQKTPQKEDVSKSQISGRLLLETARIYRKHVYYFSNLLKFRVVDAAQGVIKTR